MPIKPERLYTQHIISIVYAFLFVSNAIKTYLKFHRYIYDVACGVFSSDHFLHFSNKLTVICSAPLFSATAELLVGRSICHGALCVQISRELRSYPLPIYWYHSKDNCLRYNFALDSFYIMKLCSSLLVLYCRNCMIDDIFRYLIPILRKLRAA